jgi:hypothetical protein
VSLVTQQTIDSFFKEKRIAVIGASRLPGKYGRKLLDELRSRGFEVFPVNPNTDRIDDLPCHGSILDVPVNVTAAIVVVPPSEQTKVALEIAQTGIRKVWIHEHVMKGITNPRAIYHFEEAGIDVISGYCPFMFMPGAGFPHNLHRRITKWMGGAPN